MSTPASPPKDCWASYVDDAIQDIVDVHSSDPAWAGRFTPADMGVALASTMGWKTPDAYITMMAMQLHRQAQGNQPDGRGYAPRWLVAYSRRLKVWIITAYRVPGGKAARFTRANATSLTDILVNEVVHAFQSDYIYEIVPTLDEHKKLAAAMKPVLTSIVHPYLHAAANALKIETITLARTLSAAERHQINADIAACTTVDEIVQAYTDALIAQGMNESDVESMMAGTGVES